MIREKYPEVEAMRRIKISMAWGAMVRDQAFYERMHRRGMFGRKHSEETKEKMSQIATGRGGWKHSEETKRKMSESHQKNQYEHSEETKRRIGEGNRGKVRSEETRKKISESHKKPYDPTKRRGL